MRDKNGIQNKNIMQTRRTNTSSSKIRHVVLRRDRYECVCVCTLIVSDSVVRTHTSASRVHSVSPQRVEIDTERESSCLECKWTFFFNKEKMCINIAFRVGCAY